MSDDERYATVRELLAPLLGARVVDLTQHDEEDWRERGESFICLHFDNGATLKVPIGEDGFDLWNIDDKEAPDAEF